MFTPNQANAIYKAKIDDYCDQLDKSFADNVSSYKSSADSAIGFIGAKLEMEIVEMIAERYLSVGWQFVYYHDQSSAGTVSSEFIVSISDLKDEIEIDKYKVFT